MFDTGEQPAKPRHLLWKAAALVATAFILRECILLPKNIRPDKGQDKQLWQEENLKENKATPIPEKEALRYMSGDRDKKPNTETHE